MNPTLREAVAKLVRYKEIKDRIDLLPLIPDVVAQDEIADYRANKEAAWTALLAALDRPDDGWISVEDRLPEDWQLVIVSGGVARYIRTRDVWETPLERAIDSDEWREIQWRITHWQPLPAPPKSREDQK